MTATHYYLFALSLACIIAFSPLSPGISAGNSTHLYREGAKLALKGEIDGAIMKFKESIARNPYYSMGHYGLGKAYLKRPDKIKDAIRHLSTATRLDAKNAKAHFYLGIAYMFDKKMVKAIHAFDDAFRQDSTLIEAVYNIAAAYDMMGYDSKAYLYFEFYLTKKEQTERDILF